MESNLSAAPKVSLIRSRVHSKHDLPHHPENSLRIDHIWKALSFGGLLEHVNVLESRLVSEEELTVIHDPLYVRYLQGLTTQELIYIDEDTYIGPATYEAALYSAGCAVRGLEAILLGESRRAFALCRPPGHHAFRERPMGFCFFNNVAIAARLAHCRFGLKRIAIVDWDVHHGNGTQDIFLDDPSVLFVSLHQHPAYPHTGHVHEAGRGEGLGFTVNVPLPEGCGDSDYAACLQEIVLPVLTAYQPELIIVSAGQDALLGDPLGSMRLTSHGYATMTRDLMSLADKCANGRLLLCLEGGYDLSGQARAVRAIVEALLERGDISEKDLQVTAPARQAISAAKKVHAKYWPAQK